MMKKLSFAIFLLLVFCSVALAAIKDSPDGFRGIKWGEPPSALGASKLTEEAYGVQIYVRHDDKLKIGNANLTEISYIFNEKKFVGTIIASKGSDNNRALKNALMLRYGMDFHETPQGEVVWFDVNAMVVYQYIPEDDTASVVIMNAAAGMDMLGTLVKSALAELGVEESATESDAKSIADDF